LRRNECLDSSLPIGFLNDRLLKRGTTESLTDPEEEISNEVVLEHPLESVRKWRKQRPGQNPRILFWSEITKEQYEEFKEEFE